MVLTDANVSTQTVATGLHFAESPSVGPDGHLYVSDFYAHQVLRVNTSDWSVDSAVQVPGQPSGMGWLPDGTMLVVSMRDMVLIAVEADGTTRVHADLAPVARGAANDMFVDEQGRAWVGSFGFDFYALLAAEPYSDPLFGPEANPPTADLARVDPDGSVHLAAAGLRFPNGTTQLSDGSLVVAETVGGCLTAFTIARDGSLTGRRVLVDLSDLGIGGAVRHTPRSVRRCRPVGGTVALPRCRDRYRLRLAGTLGRGHRSCSVRGPRSRPQGTHGELRRVAEHQLLSGNAEQGRGYFPNPFRMRSRAPRSFSARWP